MIDDKDGGVDGGVDEQVKDVHVFILQDEYSLDI